MFFYNGVSGIKTLSKALLVVLLLPLISGCDLETADSTLHGRWLTYGNGSLEFTSARYTLTLPDGEVQRGTYQTDNDNISFHRTGYTSETLPYSLNFPKLVVGKITYFHDSPSMPHDLSGIWFGFRAIHSTQEWATMTLYPAKSKRDNKWVQEGMFEFQNNARGEYTLNRRNLPDSGVFVLTTTQIHGSLLWYLLRISMPNFLFDLFDWDELKVPQKPELWWFTMEEAKKFYFDAVQKANGDLFLERQILARMNRDLLSMFSVYVNNYTLTDLDGIITDFYGYEINGGTVLTLRTAAGATVTFMKEAVPGGAGASVTCNCLLQGWVLSCYHTSGDLLND